MTATTVPPEILERPSYAQLARRNGIYMVLGVVVAIAIIAVPDFATIGNAKNILRSVSLVGIVAVGMTFVVISGSFVDLSIPSIVAATSMAVLSLADDIGLLAIPVTILIAVAIGVINGLIVSGGANPVLVTLATQTIIGGCLLLIFVGANVYGERGAFLDNFGDASLGPVPVPVVVFLVVAAAAQFVLHRARFGFELYAVGANRAAARVSGVRVPRVLGGVFVISAGLAGVCGIVLGAYANSSHQNSGTGFEFDALTAVVLGGTSLFGGTGGVERTVAGVLLIGVITNAMILLGVRSEVQYLIKGTLIILAVSLDALLTRRGMER
jgi:ribose/xylose/arabinose/galactoside ABC-type transport system permease subunit